MKNHSGTMTKSDALYQQALGALRTGRLPEGIQLLMEALKENPSSGAIHNDLGTAYWQSGEPAKAELHYSAAVRHAPKNPYALNAFGTFLMEQDRLDEAETLLKRAYKLKPDHFEIPNNFGLLRHRQGRFEEAQELYFQAIKLNPKWANPYTNLAGLMRDTDKPEPAYEFFKKSVGLNPNNPIAWRGLGQAAFYLKHEEEGIAAFRQSLRLDPKSERTWAFLLNSYEKLNRMDEAEKVFFEAKKLFGSTPPIALFEAKMLRRQKKYDEAIAVMQSFIAAVKDLDTDREKNVSFYHEFWFELGMLYDRVNDVDKAFECLTAANDASRQTRQYLEIDNRAVSSEIDIIKREFAIGYQAKTASVPLDEKVSRMVFLVGFPRSGTTLLDQILSSHPDVTVAEETPATSKMSHYLLHRHGKAELTQMKPGYIAGLEDINEQELKDMRAIYFAEVGEGALQGRGKVFVDKLPLNLLHALLVRRVFPDAQFILALRHPCDSVLSNFMQRFDFNVAMVRMAEINDAAKFYDECFSLWDLMVKEIAIKAHEIHYEDVVADFKPTVEGMLNFLGLEWTDAVMNYDETARNKKTRINTPSYHQVTEKIYTRASGRWLRYKKHLKDILPILKPYAIKYGYDEADFSDD